MHMRRTVDGSRLPFLTALHLVQQAAAALLSDKGVIHRERRSKYSSVTEIGTVRQVVLRHFIAELATFSTRQPK